MCATLQKLFVACAVIVIDWTVFVISLLCCLRVYTSNFYGIPCSNISGQACNSSWDGYEHARGTHSYVSFNRVFKTWGQ